jgi:hypothetical protein
MAHFIFPLFFKSMKVLKYLLVGFVFGIILTKSEAVFLIEFMKCFSFNLFICME